MFARKGLPITATRQGIILIGLSMGAGRTGTQAGLPAGFHAISHPLPVIGVSIRHPRGKQINAAHALAQKTLEKPGVDGVPLSER